VAVVPDAPGRLVAVPQAAQQLDVADRVRALPEAVVAVDRKLATVTGVKPPSRFGELVHDGVEVSRFAEKPAGEGLISGGFFVFDRSVMERLSADPACILERGPLEGLAEDGELAVYRHDGFWQCADTVRDVELLRGLWDRGEAPWRVWDDRLVQTGHNPGRRAGDRVDALLKAAATP